jgi:DNA-binding MarR family transcriptional regulator
MASAQGRTGSGAGKRRRRSARRVSDAEYRRLLAWRSGLRQYLRWSEERAASVGLTGAQHQVLLAVAGHDDERGPTVGEIAEYLAVRPHSAVGLIDRVDRLGLVARRPDRTDRRVVRIVLTERGEASLEDLTAVHLEELARLAPRLVGIWRELGVVEA